MTSASVHSVIETDGHGFFANRKADFGDAFPDEIPQTRPAVEDGRPFSVGGLRVEPVILRGNEAIETVVFHVPAEKVVIAGDLVGERTTPVLYQGDLDGWIAQLKGLRARFPAATVIAPGHGSPGDFDTLVGAEIAYLEHFRALVQDELSRGGGTVTDAGVGRIVGAVSDAFADWRTSAGIAPRDRLTALNVGWTLAGWRIGGAGPSPAAFRE